MKSERLEKHLQRLADALSEFDDALEVAQDNFGAVLNELDARRWRLLMAIDSDFWNINESVCGMGEKTEQLKSLEGTV